jgi:hypothetical protein
MSKYSFLLQGKEPEYFTLVEGLRLRKQGGWLVAEAIEQEEISRAQSQATIRAVQLAKRIASAKGIELDEAFNLLQGGGGLSEMELLSDFTEETLSMLNSGTSMEIGNAKLVTAFMRCRGEGLIDGEWQPLDDWSIEDTKTMDRPTIAKAVEFIMSEQKAEAGAKEAQAKKAPKTKTKPEKEEELSA